MFTRQSGTSVPEVPLVGRGTPWSAFAGEDERDGSAVDSLDGHEVATHPIRGQDRTAEQDCVVVGTIMLAGDSRRRPSRRFDAAR